MDGDAGVSDPQLVARLRDLDRFFGGPPGHVPRSICPLLGSLLDLRTMLWRRERRTVFLGPFMAGKSSLLNALAGAPLLPVRANRATGVVTVVRHGPEWTALVLSTQPDGPAEKCISFDEIPESVLLNLSRNPPEPPEGVEEVRIEAALSSLEDLGVLVDTPGLLGQDVLTERSYREMERSDLAVLVLSADKILSNRERDVARHVDHLLRGNVVYVLNRMDLVDEADRDEVLDWVRVALADSGNRLVGRARIFPAAGPGAESARDEGVQALRHWLATLWSTPAGDRVAAVSRLGILEQQLAELATQLRAELSAAHDVTAGVRQEEEEALERERAGIVSRLGAGRAGLRSCRDALPSHGERFVAACVEESRQHLERPDQRPHAVRVPFDLALDRFAQEVADDVRMATLDLPVTAPPFELGRWIVQGELETSASPAEEIGARFGDLLTRAIDGGSAGREAGASVGSWIGKNVLGADMERERLKRVERVVRGTASALQAEAEGYIGRVETLLAEAEEFYRGWTRTSGRLAAAEDSERGYADLVDWCDAFSREMRAIAAEIGK